MPTGVPLLILGVIAVVALNALKDAGHFGETGFYAGVAVTAAVLGWAAWLTGALPVLDARLRASLAERMAKRLNGRVYSAEEQIWGGATATRYIVEWQSPRRPYTLEFGVSGMAFGARVPGGQAPRALVSVRNGEFAAEGEGKALAERLLDDNMRGALNAIDRLKGGGGDLSLHLSGDAVSIYKQQRLTASAAHQLVVLGTPVIERAIALMAAK